MILFIFLGVVVILSFIVLGVLFHMLSQEGLTKDEAKAVPIKDLNQLKQDSPTDAPVLKNIVPPLEETEVIPAFIPKEIPSAQDAQAPSNQEDAQKKRIAELEEELHSIKQKAEEQADVTREMILNLTKENQTLKNQQLESTDAPEKSDEAAQELASLKTENEDLKTQLESNNTKMRLLEEELTQVNAKLTELNQEKEALLSAPKPEAQEDLHPQLESLKTEQDQLKQKCEELQKANQELQYDLVKARAQSSGLERVSFNYKNQLEEFMGKVKAAQEANDLLVQEKKTLETGLEEIKTKNEELAQKDQLTQFELEKNRSKLLALEREIEDLKAKSQQQNQQ